jgi:hypothetical protein
VRVKAAAFFDKRKLRRHASPIVNYDAEKAVFKPASNDDVPDLSGAFRSARNKDDVFILARATGTTNTFTATAPDKSTMKLIFEPLKTAGRYVVQMENPAGPEVMLGICALSPGAVEIHGLNPAEVPALAKQYGVELDGNGRITKQPSLAKLKGFFDACFDSKYSTVIDTVTVGGAQEQGGEARGK